MDARYLQRIVDVYDALVDYEFYSLSSIEKEIERLEVMISTLRLERKAAYEEAMRDSDVMRMWHGYSVSVSVVEESAASSLNQLNHEVDSMKEKLVSMLATREKLRVYCERLRVEEVFRLRCIKRSAFMDMMSLSLWYSRQQSF